jgi:penicillin-insensitive murein DD-endopeptidase
MSHRYYEFFRKTSQLSLLTVLLLGQGINAGVAHDPQKKELANKIFEKLKLPTKGNSSSIGSYAKGCLDGAQALPFNGPNWQVLHPSRKRNWGHPETIRLVKRLSKKATEIGWKGLYIGDISQARGGPMRYGHKSHQMGLDVDIWLTPPQSVELTVNELKAVKPISIRSKDHRRTNNKWTVEHMEILKASALDKSVDRVFITAPAKIWMCEKAEGDRNWLQKIRPLGGHHQHFHIRLKCPPESPFCKTQKPSIPDISQSDDGCDHTLKWWVTTALEPYKKPAKPPKKKKLKKNALNFLMSDLPKQCLPVIHNN